MVVLSVGVETVVVVVETVVVLSGEVVVSSVVSITVKHCKQYWWLEMMYQSDTVWTIDLIQKTQQRYPNFIT